MNQIACYKSLTPLLILFLSSSLDATLLKPTQNNEEKEILIVNGKRRLYYPISQEGTHYSLEGPTRIEFISRYPVLKKKKNSHSFKYLIVINGVDTVNVNHRYKIQRSIKSVQHPKHNYTYSGNYFINLDKGSHTIELLTEKEQKYPVLMRVLAKEFESMGKNKKILKPMVHKNSLDLVTDGRSINYFECIPGLPLQVEALGKKTLRILTRLQFSDSMGQEASYRLKVSEGPKVIGTYYFNTERSSSSQIGERMDKVPGKWRSCEVSVPKGKHRFNIEVLDRDKIVLTRFILY
ncbi:MAG: hypothetical protein CMA06_04650 [Euryarchaeota archaeon]|nr:hypothetical protein [Euryarchaeota archaeon]|tara:strand:+ start:1257 stop:2135 length:879 start_codon:yes stop_codon:yes gene_type:complete